jgi:hypothetical protein
MVTARSWGTVPRIFFRLVAADQGHRTGLLYQYIDKYCTINELLEARGQDITAHLLINSGYDGSLALIELKVSLDGWFDQIAGIDQQQLTFGVLLLHIFNDGFLSGQTARLVAVSAAEIKVAVNGSDVDDAQVFRFGPGGGSTQLMAETQTPQCYQQPGKKCFHG